MFMKRPVMVRFSWCKLAIKGIGGGHFINIIVENHLIIFFINWFVMMADLNWAKREMVVVGVGEGVKGAVLIYNRMIIRAV